MPNRRDFLAGSGAAALALAISRSTSAAVGGVGAAAPSPGALLRRTIPSSGEHIVAVGLGTARRYAAIDDAATRARLSATLARFAQLGGQMVDTAPSYGEAESVLGELVGELGLRERLFFASKVSSTGAEQGLAQLEDSFRRLRTKVIDLMYVHNLQDVQAQLDNLRLLRDEGRVRYIGATTSAHRQHEAMARLIAREPMDLVQVDYAIDNRRAAETIFPVAQARGVGVVVNLPFGRNRLFDAVRGLALPAWAADFDCGSWAQFFLKYVLSHPAVTCVIPGMSRPEYIDDNLAAAQGRLPDADQRRRMEQFIGAL